MQTHPRIAELISHADPAARQYGVEMTAAIEGEKAAQELASLIKSYNSLHKSYDPHVALINVVRWHPRLQRMGWQERREEEARLARWHASDCAIHVLSALHIYRSRPEVPFKGALPDLTAVRDVLAAGRVVIPFQRRIEYRAHRERLRSAAASCRRWWQAAKKRGGPELETRHAYQAVYAVMQSCASTESSALEIVLPWALAAATSPDAEAAWQRLHFIELLRGRTDHLPLPTDPLFCSKPRSSQAILEAA